MLKKYFSALIIFVMIAFVGQSFANDIPASERNKNPYLKFFKDDGGYLKNSTNGAIQDTISLTANDTSHVFTNDEGYNYLYVELSQNGTTDSYLINYPATGKVRIRNVAADSTWITEVKGQLGWIKVPIIKSTSSTNSASYQIPLKSGNGLITIRGTNKLL